MTKLWSDLLIKGPTIIKNPAPSAYQFSSELEHAIEVALLLGRPLLVTGEPGVGKTELANAVAARLNIPLFRFSVKSTSIAEELLYSYDPLARFYDAEITKSLPDRANTNTHQQWGPPEDGETLTTSYGSTRNRNPASYHDYIAFQPLGLAILAADRRPSSRRMIANYISLRQHRVDVQFGNQSTSLVDFIESGCKIPGINERSFRSVVLIDEIDKAPRDFGNDLLNELESLEFVVKETGDRFRAESSCPPLIVMTSNRERDLPEPVLRRCLYFHIEPPDEDRLREIIGIRLGLSTDLTKKMIGLLRAVRTASLSRSPSTGEILQWALLLATQNISPTLGNAALEGTILTLAKRQEDQDKIRRAFGI